MVGVFCELEFYNGDVFPTVGEGGAKGEVRSRGVEWKVLNSELSP